MAEELVRVVYVGLFRGKEKTILHAYARLKEDGESWSEEDMICLSSERGGAPIAGAIGTVWEVPYDKEARTVAYKKARYIAHLHTDEIVERQALSKALDMTIKSAALAKKFNPLAKQLEPIRNAYWKTLSFNQAQFLALVIKAIMSPTAYREPE